MDNSKKISDDILKMFKAVDEAAKAIRATKQKSGHIECPLCKGRLAFAINSYNHIHAKCETEKCLSWME